MNHDQIILIVSFAIVIFLGLVIYFYLRKRIAESKIGKADEESKRIISDAMKEAETEKKEAILEAKEEAHKLRNDLEKEIRERRNEVQRLERRLIQKEETLDKKSDLLEKRDENLNKKQQSLQDQEENINQLYEKERVELERISGLNEEQAKELLLDEIRKEVQHDAAKMVKDIETRAKEEADKKAKEIITCAIQRCAADHVAETTVYVVNLPNDEMKGRIIGREGRNIRTLETLTGIDLIIDDTPEAVILSGFDPIRREVARIALEKLIVDGRIHPARIEEMVDKATKEVENDIREEGEQATFETGVHEEYHREFRRLKALYHQFLSFQTEQLRLHVSLIFCSN